MLNQTGQNLVDVVFKVDSPVLSISADRTRRIALRNMLTGVFSYLRNPYHHSVDNQVEQSWAWSTVGLLDRLLKEIADCMLMPQEG